MTRLPGDIEAARRALLLGSALFDVAPTVIEDTVATAPSPADSGLTLTPTDATLFPDPSADEGVFYAIVYPTDVIPTAATVEILHVTALDTGEWTIERAQYRSQQLSIATGWEIRYSSEAAALDLLAYLGLQAQAALNALPSVYEFTADDASWDLPVGAVSWAALLRGAGGGGAGGQVGNPENGGGGGGGGAFTFLPSVDASEFTVALEIIVGAGGPGGAANANGTAGEASSVAQTGGSPVYVTANGGAEGLATGAGGAGGAAAGAGYVSEAGGDGGTGTPSAKGNGSSANRASGGGGSGGWNDGGGAHAGGSAGNTGVASPATIRGGAGGTGGSGNTVTGATGSAGNNYGGGGGGGGGAGTTAGAGGAGKVGRVWVFVE